MANFQRIKKRLFQSKLFKDSFWAIMGNGIGNLLIMLSGIFVARLLGKDLYGEYGVVKTTMFYIASFSCFGMGVTSTKFISQALKENPTHIRSIVKDTLKISSVFSITLSSLIFIFAGKIALYMQAPSLTLAFRLLSFIIIFRSLTLAQIGLLSGFRKFRESAINSFLSGLFLILVCVPVSYMFSLKGALFSLMFSQIFNFIINAITLSKVIRNYSNDYSVSYTREMIYQSFPVALQESLISLSNWFCILILTKMSDTGEVGIYSAAAQWNAVISMIPVLLSNVILSYISGSIGNKNEHDILLKRMIVINVAGTFVPFILVFCFATFITSFYGPSFSNLVILLRVYTFITVIDCCTNVFKSEFVASNKMWHYFLMRLFREVILICFAYYFLSTGNSNGATLLSYACIIASFSFLIMQIFCYKIISREKHELG